MMEFLDRLYMLIFHRETITDNNHDTEIIIAETMYHITGSLFNATEIVNEISVYKSIISMKHLKIEIYPGASDPFLFRWNINAMIVTKIPTPNKMPIMI